MASQVVDLTPDREKRDTRRVIRWWAERKANDRAKAVQETVQTIKDDQSELRDNYLRHLRMYRNQPIIGLSPVAFRTLSTRLGAPLSLNALRNMCNTVTSKLAKMRPRITFSCDGASRKMREKARKLEQWTDGFFFQEGIYQQAPRCFLDCTVFGTGYMKVFPDRGDRKVCAERVFPPNIIVDSIEGAEGRPQNKYQTAFVDRHTLATKFPKHRDRIMEVESTLGENVEDLDEYLIESSANSVHDILMVHESWHLPSEPGSGDGMCTLSVEDIELSEKTWKLDYFPFATIRWTQPPVGYEGMGLAEELVGIQVEINRLVRKIQLAFELLANPYLLVDRASGVSKGHITDIPGSIVEYNGKEPRVYSPQTVHPEVFAHLDRLYKLAYEITGVSQMAATSKVPANLESGRALLVHEDVQSDRFATVGQAYEQFFVDIDELGIDAARQVPGYKVRVFGEDRAEELNFKRDIDLKRDQYVMKPFPTALLAGSPAGKLDTAERMVKMGLVKDETQVLEMLDAPDTKGHVMRETAGRRLVEGIIDRILNGEEYEPPEAHMDLVQAVDIAQKRYIEARKEGVPRVRLQEVTLWMHQAIRMGDMGQPPAPIGPAPMGAAPGIAMPGPGGVPGGLPPEMSGMVPPAGPQGNLPPMPVPAGGGGPPLPPVV
jgi:hypothetical protein